MFRLLIGTASSRVQAEENGSNDPDAQQYIELSDEDTGFQYTSLLFRYEDLEMTRSFNLAIPATPHNNAVLGFSEHPAASGDAITNEMGCTLLYDTGQVNGNISIVDYSDGAYNACLTLSDGVSALRTLAEATNLKTALGSSTEEIEDEEEGTGTGTIYTVADPYTLSVVMDWDGSAACRSDIACGTKAPNLCIQNYYTESEGGGTFFDVCYGKSGFVAVGPYSIVSSEDGKQWKEIYTTGQKETAGTSISGFYACAAYDNNNSETTYYVRCSNTIHSFTGIDVIENLTLFVSGLQTPYTDIAQNGYKSNHAFAPLCVAGDNLYFTSKTSVYRISCGGGSFVKLTGNASSIEYTYSMAADNDWVYGVGRHSCAWKYKYNNNDNNTTSGKLQSKKNGWFVSYEGKKWLAGVAGNSGKETQLFYNDNNNSSSLELTSINGRKDKTIGYSMFCGGYWNGYYIVAGQDGHSYYVNEINVSDIKKWKEASIGNNTWWGMVVKNKDEDDDEEQIAVLVGTNGIKYLSSKDSETPDTWNSAALTISSLPGDMPYMPCVSYMYLLESISAQLDLGWTAEADEYYDTIGKWLVIVLPTAVDSGGNKLQQGDTFYLMDNLPDIEPLDLFLTYGAITGRTLGLKNNERGVPCLHFFNYNWADGNNYNEGEATVNPVYYGLEELGSDTLTRGVGGLACNNFIRFTEGELTEERADGYETNYSVPNSTLTAESDWYTSPLASGSTLGGSLYLKNIEYTREVDEEDNIIRYTDISWEGEATVAVWKGCSAPLGTLRAFDMGQNEDLNRVLQEKTTYEVTIPMPFYQFMGLNILSLVTTSARVWCVYEAAWQNGLSDLTLVRLNAQNYDGTGVGGATLTVTPAYIYWRLSDFDCHTFWQTCEQEKEDPEQIYETCVTVESNRGVTYSTSSDYLQVERCGEGEDEDEDCCPEEEGEGKGIRYKISYTGPGSDEADSSDFTAALGTHYVYFQSGNKTARVAVIISTEPEDETEIPCAYAWMDCIEPEPDDMPSWATCGNE